MISASNSLKDLIKSNNSISVSAGALVEYNLNSMVEYIKATSYGADHIKFSKAFQKLFPIDTLYKPFRPLAPGIKYLIYTSGNTDTPDQSYQTVKTLDMSSKPRLYYPGPDTYYKYWVGPKNENIDISLEYFFDEAKTVVKNIITNKVVARFENNHDVPASWTIKATKSDNTEVTLGSGTSLNSKGEAVVYYNGTTWSSTEPSTYTISESFKKITLQAVNSNSGKFLAVIELSPRWVVDVSDDVSAFEVRKESSDSTESFLPVGKITSNYLYISLNKYKQNEKNIIEYNRNALEINTSKLYLFKNTIIKPYIQIKNIDTYEKVYQGTYYMHSWSISEFGEAQINALDSAKILQETLSPEILVENGSVILCIKRILDSIGFSNYYIHIKKDQNGNIIDESIPNLSYWWTNSTETVWETLQSLCKDFQINAFVDENNVLNFYTRDYIYDNTREIDWAFTSEPITEGSLTVLPNIISFNSSEVASANEVRVRYSVPGLFMGDNTSQPLWESETYMLGAGSLAEDLSATSTDYFNLETTSFNTTQTNKLLGGFSGYVLINNEVIEYDGIEYQYVPMNSSTEDPIPVLIKSATDIAKYENLSKKNTLTKRYFMPTGRYKIKKRGALSTENSQKAHFKSASSYINTTPNADVNKFNKYGPISLRTSQDKQYKPESGTYKTPINPMSNTVAKSFLSLSNLDKDKTSFDVAIKSFNSINTSGNYFAFGTRMFFDSQFESPEQAGGLAIFTDPQGDYGYYLVLRSTAFAALKKDLMLIKKWKIGNKTGIKVLKDSQDNTFSTLAGIYSGTAYNIDVVIKKEVNRNIITVFVNGFKMVAQDIMFESGNDDVLPVSISKNIGVNCGQGVVYFEYLYAKSITENEYNNISIMSGMNYKGIYSDDTLSLLYGDLIYAAGETVESQNESLVEFGTTAREIRKVKTVYSERPAVANYVRTGNNKYATVLAQRIQPFSFEAYVLNNTATSIPLHDGYYSSFYVNGARITKSSPIDYDTKSDTDSNNVESVILDTNWIQSESDAKRFAEWVKTTVLNKGRSIQMEIFGNPLLSPGDIVSINYPLQGISQNQKYIITNVTFSYEEGVNTSVVCRAI